MLTIFNQHHDSDHGVTEIARIKLGSGDIVRIRPTKRGNMLVVNKNAVDSGHVLTDLKSLDDESFIVRIVVRSGEYTAYFCDTQDGLTMVIDGRALESGNVVLSEDTSIIMGGGFKVADISKLQGDQYAVRKG